jgi:putative hydrolase of the HAD superfamily
MITATATSPAAAGAQLRSAEYVERLARMPHGLIVDMDDTLNSNQPLFEVARTELSEIYAELDPRGRRAEELIALNRQVNREFVPVYGYTPKRWYHVAHLVAAEITGRELTDVETARIQQAADIAMGVGDILPGVIDALTALRDAGVRMLLKTKGELVKQQEKLAAHGFAAYFGGQVEIVDAKTEESFRALTAKYELQSPVSIGDSEKSDILPAVACGFRAILIDHGMTVWDTADRSAGHEVARVGSFPEAILLLADEQ